MAGTGPRIKEPLTLKLAKTRILGNGKVYLSYVPIA
jgi:hypothetical protein